MCFSASVSLATYLLGSVFSYLLYLENEISYKIIGIFMGYVVLMQLIEFLLWSHQVCDIYNKSISFAGMILNYFQPFILGILLLQFYKSIPELNTKVIKAILIIYSIAIILYVSQFIFLQNKCTLKKDSPYLLWKWGQMNNNYIITALYLFTLFTLFYIGIPNKMTSYAIMIFAFITLLISFMYYPRPFFGAIWCFFGAFIPMLLYFYKKITDKLT
jgi:hypothetical protein